MNHYYKPKVNGNRLARRLSTEGVLYVRYPDNTMCFKNPPGPNSGGWQKSELLWDDATDNNLLEQIPDKIMFAEML